MKLKKKKAPTVEADVVQADVKTPEQKTVTDEQMAKIDARILAFEATYNNLFTPQDFALVRPEAMICNLLFAIWVEVRELKELVKLDTTE